MTGHPDFLRSPKTLFDPDPRSSGYEVLSTQGFRPKELQDQHDAVAEITLHAGVPAAVVVKFETAKNLNLFSWFVYRFHSAARSHAYECLELALKIRFKDELYARKEQKNRARFENEVSSNPNNVKAYQPIDKDTFRPTLRPLLEYAIETGTLKNERFSVWQQKTKVRARYRRDVEAIEKMKELGLSELAIDDSQLEIKDEDRDHDYLGQVIDSVPFLRNEYAHGTTALDNQSLGPLRRTAEIINQIFPETGQRPGAV